MTVASGVLTVAGEVSMTTLDIGGTNVTSTAAELQHFRRGHINGHELNIIDGGTQPAPQRGLTLIESCSTIMGP
jgi:hypothetical protein